jgi:signal transduction histidine kinase/CheY-like chemotaxis protein
VSGAQGTDSLDVLVLAPTGRDASLIHGTLTRESYACRTVSTLADVQEAVRTGVGTAVIAEEALTASAVRALSEQLATQPTWSDVPLIVLSSGPRQRRALISLEGLGNVTVLDRPVQVRTLLSAVAAALRARRRQLAARHEIRQRDQFLAMLGHELRNPLGAIAFASDLLLRSAGTEDAERHLSIIQRQSRHLSRLVDDLLEVSRVTAGKVVLDRRGVDLADALRRAVGTLEEPLQKRGLALTLTLREPSLLIEADAVRLEQVFCNLIMNAIKYTPVGGKIFVTLDRDARGAVVAVRDTGIGIEAAMLPRVFELFAQAQTAIARTQGGMGIGLTLVKHLVALHGGKVEAHSPGLGQGSEFVVTFPLSEQVLARAPVSVPPPAPSESLRLVVVEDNPDLSELLKDVLEEYGHSVEVAADGVAGAALIASSAPDCAFVDIGLPGLDGYEVARTIRASAEVKTKLVALTGYGQFEDHLKKPVDMPALEKLLRKLASTRA